MSSSDERTEMSSSTPEPEQRSAQVKASTEGDPAAAADSSESSAPSTDAAGEKDASAQGERGEAEGAERPKRKRRRRRKKSSEAADATSQTNTSGESSERAAGTRTESNDASSKGPREGKPRGRREQDSRRGRDGGPGRGRKGAGRGRDGRGRRDQRSPREEAQGAGRGGATLKVSMFSALANMREFDEVGDREVGCRNSGCERTWTWSREAQAAAKLRGAPAKPPKRQCDACYAKERALTPQDVPCRVRGCTETWTWDVDAQLRHRVWFEREKARYEASQHEAAPKEESEASPPAKTEAAPAPTEEAGKQDASAETSRGSKKKRRDKKKRSAPKEGPPPKLCERCEAKIKTVTPRDVTCKVHGCGQTWVWNREQQLEAWAKLEAHDGSVTPKNPRRMCKRCFDFCRKHQDSSVECGKPGCDRTWNYQVGAQLQDHLAGRKAPSSKLACDFSKGAMDCEFRATMRVELAQLPPGAELMPCAVAGCVGKWVYTPGMELSSSSSDGPSVDHMCDHHRLSFGATARGSLTPPATDEEATAEAVDETQAAASEASMASETPREVESPAEDATAEGRDVTEARVSEEAKTVTEDSAGEQAEALPSPDDSASASPGAEDEQ
ncbi:MAG: hypothetical protein ACPHRO_01305 [Nannocystaceae bacterium]